jgi:hypothetical protein
MVGERSCARCLKFLRHPARTGGLLAAIWRGTGSHPKFLPLMSKTTTESRVEWQG